MAICMPKTTCTFILDWEKCNFDKISMEINSWQTCFCKNWGRSVSYLLLWTIVFVVFVYVMLVWYLHMSWFCGIFSYGYSFVTCFCSFTIWFYWGNLNLHIECTLPGQKREVWTMVLKAKFKMFRGWLVAYSQGELKS